MTFTDDEVRIGVVLVTISGVAWRITTADGSACFGMEGTEFDHCGRQQCLRNNSMSHGLLYPEFQYRQPPPTYQASMQEYRLRLLLLDRDRSHGRRIVNAVSNPQSSSSPPPTYRSNTGSQLRSTSDRSGKDCCGQWFNGPPLRFLVALVALGRVACTLGGATLGSIALAGSPTSHLTAGLLMTDLIKTGPVWSNFILLTTNFLKLFHMNYNLQAIEKLVKRVQTIYESSHIIHYHRYQKNFKINTITQILYPAAIYGAQLMFFLMPIIQNVVALSYGADHWERIIQHQLYFPYSLEPWHFYILTYFWIEYVAFFNNGYMVGNEILFDTLLVMISMEFDNLADEFKDFDFEHPDLKEFKKLKDRHSELLEISDEMNSNYNFPIMVTFLSSSVVICFSLLQVFSDNEKMFSFTTGSFYNLIKFGAYLNGAFLQIFLLSFFCEKLRTSSENIAKKIANSNWYMCKDIGMKKNYQMVLLKAQQPVELTALNFFGINIEIFTHVISTAYSYFGVLKSFR